jgi:hypothetical protein
MTSRHREFAFTARERLVMQQNCSLPEELRSLILSDTLGPIAVRLTPAQVDLLRDAVADRLQQAGFDAEWNLNEEGTVLEGIIDKLQPPASE